MRPMLIVPRGVVPEFTTHTLCPERYENLSRAFRLHRSDEPLYDGDAAVLADCSESRRILCLAFTPADEARAVEDAVSVHDKMPGGFTSFTYRSTEECSDLHRRRLLLVDGETYDGAGEVVNYDCDPPTKGPTLKTRERKPGYPESC